MRNKVFSKYSLIDLHTVEGRQRFNGALTAFMRQPNEIKDKLIAAGITNFTSSADFPRDMKQLIETYHLGLEEVDLGWLQFFDERNFVGTPTSGFRVREASSGLTFSKRPEGGRAQVYSVSGTEVFVGFDTYGGGLEFDEAWFQDQEWWLIEDTAMEFRSRWYQDKATVMYTLIGALGAGYNTAYDGAGATQLDKDINTINAGATALLSGLKSAGYAVTPSTPLKVLSPLELRGRLQRALAAQYITPATAGASLKIEYNIAPVYSMNVIDGGAATTTKWFMGVAGMKNKIGEKMPLTVFSDFKAESFATTSVGWGRYGAYLNELQWRRLASA